MKKEKAKSSPTEKFTPKEKTLPEREVTRNNYSLLLGLDEAGRGPVLGPLVMAALVVDAAGEKKLQWLGVKDSKLLSAETREELFERIREMVWDFRVEVIEPDAIDLSLSEAHTNLNWLEADTAARMISELVLEAKEEKLTAVVDCPSPNIRAYEKYFWKKLDSFDTAIRKKLDLRLEHKADANHIIVGAASIVAKVIRDRAVEYLKKEIGIDFGSGYMSDQKTKDFLEKYHEKYPQLFRKKWQSYLNVIEKKKQKKLGEF